MTFGDYISDSVAAALDMAAFGIGRTDLVELLDHQREVLRDHGYATDPAAMPADQIEALGRLGREITEVLAIPDDKLFLATLADMLDARDARPSLTDHDGEPHIHYARDGAPVAEWLGTVAVAGLVHHICRYGRTRLRRCAALDCGRWYADNSRNRSRRYCSSACASRTTVGAYRARQR